jgi:hypothetical protein
MVVVEVAGVAGASSFAPLLSLQVRRKAVLGSMIWPQRFSRTQASWTLSNIRKLWAGARDLPASAATDTESATIVQIGDVLELQMFKQLRRLRGKAPGPRLTAKSYGRACWRWWEPSYNIVPPDLRCKR